MELLIENIFNFFATTLKEKRINAGLVEEFQKTVLNSENISENPEIEILLRDLALDLDYYEPDEHLRRESISYFGDNKALQLIETTYTKIKAYK